MAPCRSARQGALLLSSLWIEPQTGSLERPNLETSRAGDGDLEIHKLEYDRDRGRGATRFARTQRATTLVSRSGGRRSTRKSPIGCERPGANGGSIQK